MSTLFERLGGEAVLRPIIHDFVLHMTGDLMIGFFFAAVDRARLEQREYELTARFLGADIPYSGRPIDQAHAAHRIMGGQFDRRATILKETLIRHGVDPAIQAAWLEHVESLRPLITQQQQSQCD